MNFREDYRSEMNNIQRDKRIDAEILSSISETDCRKNSGYIWKPAMAALFTICMAVTICNFDAIVSFGESVFGKYMLSAGGEKMYLASMEPIAFDKEAFMNDENTQKSSWEHESYWQHFETYEEFKSITGMEFPNAEELSYSSIMVDACECGAGHLSMKISYENKWYRMNGMFIYEEAEDLNEWGYGETERPSEVYEYGDGKKAYFIEDKIYDENHLQRVYFSEGGILFQFFFERTEEEKTVVKEIINRMSDESSFQ